MPWYKRLMGIDRRVLYIIMVLAIAIPMFYPLGLPVPSDEPTQAAYDYITSLPAGSKILYSLDTSASGITELKPAFDVLVRKSFELGHKVYFIALWAEGNSFAKIWGDPITTEYKAEYGVDYCNLGYQPSYQSFLEQSRSDLYGACNGGVDANGAKLTTIPMMKNVTKAKDFTCVVTFNSGDPGPTAWIQQWNSTESVPIVSSSVAVNTPTMTNYYQAGLLKGNVSGLSGAAYLEKIAGKLGAATGGMDSQSMGHVVIILFLILGNIGYFAARKAGEVK